MRPQIMGVPDLKSLLAPEARQVHNPQQSRR
jgi:hypothetical protein